MPGINYSLELCTDLWDNQPGNSGKRHRLCVGMWQTWGAISLAIVQGRGEKRPWLPNAAPRRKLKNPSPLLRKIEINYKCLPLRRVCFSVLVFSSELKVKEQSPVLFFSSSFWNEAIGLPYLTRWIKCGEKITEFNQHSHSVYVVGNHHSKKDMEN